MDQNKLQQLQQQFSELQSKISETASTENVTITMNGKIEITSLQLKKQVVDDVLIAELISAANAVIKQASQKVQQAMIQIQTMTK